MPLENISEIKSAANLPNIVQGSSRALEQKMVSLYQTIVSLLGSDAPKTIQILSARATEGSSVIAREFARVVAGKLGKRVLLLDANQPHCQCAAFGVTPSLDWEEALTTQHSIQDALVPVGDSALQLSVLSLGENLKQSVIETPLFGSALEEVAEQFHMVIIDAPPAAEAAEGLTLSPIVSGTVLVIEAGQTRWQVADSVQRRIEKYGGRVLGAVLNKRRDYIPSVIYDRL